MYSTCVSRERVLFRSGILGLNSLIGTASMCWSLKERFRVLDDWCLFGVVCCRRRPLRFSDSRPIDRPRPSTSTHVNDRPGAKKTSSCRGSCKCVLGSFSRQRQGTCRRRRRPPSAEHRICDTSSMGTCQPRRRHTLGRSPSPSNNLAIISRSGSVSSSL
jgi:hypothetical protein